MDILNIENLNVIYKNNTKRIKAVKNLNLSLKEKISYGIVGESGSGKSTLAMSILGLLPKEISEVSGKIIYNKQDLLSIDEKELNRIRWKDISVVFQSSMNSLSPVHKIGNQILEIYRVHDRTKSKKDIKEIIIKLLKKMNLSEKVYYMYPHELSGGMYQRVCIALSILFNPKILILDEATTALDLINEKKILDEIIEIEKDFRVTRIMITHDISIVNSSCKEIIVMYGGYIVEKGNTKDIFKNPKHPYTKGLIESYPRLKDSKKRLTGISGKLPDLSRENKGCIFYPRCNKKNEICKNNQPQLKDKEGWSVACFFQED